MNDFETAKQFFMEGLQFLQANNLEGAETRFARSLEILPERVSTLNNLSAIKLKRRQFAEREQFARNAIAFENQSAEAWSNLGIALLAREQFEEALKACASALETNRSHARLWL